MKMILDYLISSAVYAFIAVPFVVLLRLKHYKAPVNLKKELAILLFFMSIAVIFCQTAIPPQFLNGEFTAEAFHAPDISYFRQYPHLATGWLLWKIKIRDWAEIAVNIGGNILVFLPIGLLAPYIWKQLKAHVIFVGFLLSCSVEFIQLFTDRTTDYNDIILNTIGTVLGYLLFLILNQLKKKYSAKKQENRIKPHRP